MYSGSPPTIPATEEMLTMRPPSPRSIMRLPTVWAMRNVPRTLTCTTWSNFSSGISSGGAPQVVPLLLTRTSIAPKASSVSATTLFTSSGSVTSQASASALPPRPSISALTSSSASFLRAQRTTLAPASESASAMYWPSPRPPPVTMAVLLSRRNRSSAFVRSLASVSILLLSSSSTAGACCWPSLRSLRLLLVSEHASQELADGTLGQLVAELDRFGGFIGGEALFAEGQYLVLCRLTLRLLDHERLDRLAAVLVRDTDGYRFGHPLVLVQNLLDLSRVDVVAARGDHILLAVHDTEVTVLVHTRHVASVEPAVPERLLCLLGHVPVALHDLGPPDDQLT